MLIHLNIKDFAIIKDLEITLRPGLNILSGETGAGKSIIINAMNLILGGRASADLIRSGCKEARVEALFSSPENSQLAGVLSCLGLPFDGELLIKRIVSLEGRNRISINGSMATLQILSALSSTLISISGQYENQLLLKPDNHLYLLDDFGGLSDERREFSGSYNKQQSLKEEIRHLEKEIQEISKNQELNRFQIQEIDGAEITLGEDKILTEEKMRLEHAGELLEILSEGYLALYERNDSILSAISLLTKRMDKGAEMDQRLSPLRDQLREVEMGLEDISFSLRDSQKSIHIDPHRLEEVLDRLELLNRLKRKYGSTLEDIQRYKDNLGIMLDDVDKKRQRLDSLEKERQGLENDLMEKAMSLSSKRKKAAKSLERAVEKELQYLHMRETRFLVRFNEDGSYAGETENGKTREVGADGLDCIEFLISPNVGEELRPLSKIASGGELSRIMLAIKTILARSASVETIIFDEVDSGISGATAEVVGEKVLSLAEYHQILCITHLPQIACQGRTHFLVKKDIVGGRTHTTISELDNKARVREIARLVGGKEITSSALAHAREMLNQA